MEGLLTLLLFAGLFYCMMRFGPIPFAFSFTHPRTAREWRSSDAFSARIVFVPLHNLYQRRWGSGGAASEGRS
jgi:hypothetical protein